MRISLHQLRTIIREETTRLRENHSDEYPEGYFGMRDHPGHDEEMEDEELPPEAFEDEDEDLEPPEDYEPPEGFERMAADRRYDPYDGWSAQDIADEEQNRWERGLNRY